MTEPASLSDTTLTSMVTSTAVSPRKVADHQERQAERLEDLARGLEQELALRKATE